MAIWNERIRGKRLEKGLTLAQIADKLGITEATAQRYESGSIKSVPYDYMCAYGEILGCSPAYLMGWEPEQDPTFSFFLDKQMELLGYSILYDTEGNVTLFYKDEQYEITDIDVKELRASTKSYLTFKLQEIKQKSKKYTSRLNAAHERTDTEVTAEMQQHDDDIMNSDDF